MEQDERVAEGAEDGRGGRVGEVEEVEESGRGGEGEEEKEDDGNEVGQRCEEGMEEGAIGLERGGGGGGGGDGGAVYLTQRLYAASTCQERLVTEEEL